jgi:hypothetical protein
MASAQSHRGQCRFVDEVIVGYRHENLTRGGIAAVVAANGLAGLLSSLGKLADELKLEELVDFALGRQQPQWQPT